MARKSINGTKKCFSIPEQLNQTLEEKSNELDIPVSALIRGLIRIKMNEVKSVPGHENTQNK